MRAASSTARTCGCVDASSAMQSSRCGYACPNTDAIAASSQDRSGLCTGITRLMNSSAIVSFCNPSHRLELRGTWGMQRQPAAVLAATGRGCVGHADRPAQVAIPADEPRQGRGTFVDQRQGPGCRLVQGLLAARLRGHHPPRLANQGHGDPGRRAAGRIGELRPERLELGLELRDVAPRCEQVFGEPVRIVAGRRHRAESLRVVPVISKSIERRWYAGRPQSAAA